MGDEVEFGLVNSSSLHDVRSIISVLIQMLSKIGNYLLVTAAWSFLIDHLVSLLLTSSIVGPRTRRGRWRCRSLGISTSRRWRGWCMAVRKRLGTGIIAYWLAMVVRWYVSRFCRGSMNEEDYQQGNEARCELHGSSFRFCWMLRLFDFVSPVQVGESIVDWQSGGWQRLIYLEDLDDFLINESRQIHMGGPGIENTIDGQMDSCV